MTSDKVKPKISDFLKGQYLKKSEPDRKKLEKATDLNEISILKESIQQLKEKYSLNNWIDYAANTYANQLKFGTHISKGIHPDAKGDNVTFQSLNQLKNNLVGSQSIHKLELDANGNAAALPLASFFNIIIDEDKQIKLKDLLLNNDPSLEKCFANEIELSEKYKQIFQNTLKGNLDTPITHERNKQLLWVNDKDAIKNNDYTCLIPLYPSAFTNIVYNKINQSRYSEENKVAREKRYKNKKDDVQQSYISINDLSTVKLGGTKPQNVSLLTSSQGGRNYLLPSLPPIISSTTMRISYSQTTIFTERLAYVCRYGLRMLYEVIKEKKNIYTVRDERIDALNIILQTLLRQVNNLQQKEVAWTKDYQLDWCEKYWLDPNRWQNEEQHYDIYQRQDWINEIDRRFALWINDCLKKQFPKIAHQFNNPEYETWRKQFRRALRLALRNK
ncbi:CRISPR-associated Csy1 family protein [Bisgaardia hudsonensis]|uniref:CRISPR-associated Csy1 family protein n=1 Tax=Bisgaardia hudsonensis TaxID=109472 RepID=A0A4R2MYI6_9PAST|nr:type I-F CRISPR-associated protein Csy1 [Bisgaardia hudsonensis]TCP11456.1 CRISPR-associated Csy1 family protein [Bisgaardia hudsonensis]